VTKTKQRQYRSETLEKGLGVLDLLERSHEPLRVQDVVKATSLDRTAVFRLLCTLEYCGYIERLPDKRYRPRNRHARPRIAYIAPLTGNSFRLDVVAGMRSAAAEADMELLLVDSKESDPNGHLAKVQEFINSGLKLVILFQPVDSAAHVLADRFIGAAIPIISVDVPIPGALFFGGNSYRAGLMAGEALGRFAKERWESKFDRLLLLESSLSAPENKARLSGAVEGLREVLGEVPEAKIMHLDGLAHREASRAACEEVFRSLPAKSRVLISSFNDLSAMGALEAVSAAKRGSRSAIVGQNGTAEIRVELMRPESALIASVAYFPEKYGEKLIRLASAVLAHEKTPLAVYTEHILLDRSNVLQYYPAS
jgi:ribose transport system substrate-binding protein